MKTKSGLPDLNDVLNAFSAAPEVSPAEVQKIAAANSELDNNPAFLADLQKAKVATTLRRALEKRHESLSSFAARWNKTRQYVSRIFGADQRTNFTIETITQAAFLLGLRVTVQVHRPDQQVVVRPRLAGCNVYRYQAPVRSEPTLLCSKNSPDVQPALYPDPLAA